MCGRYTLISVKTLHDRFNIAGEPTLFPRYNIAPSQEIPVIRAGADPSRRHLDLMRWGLIPSWAKDASIGSRMINARSEGVESKPAFRKAFQQRRCLIPADGFYEWKKTGKRKQPFYFQMKSNDPFAFAGLWEKWRDPLTTKPVESCTILTTQANALLNPIHDRMPLILDRRDYPVWLDPHTSADKLHSLLHPFPAEQMKAQPVSPHVNSPRNEDPSCIEAITTGDDIDEDESEPQLF